MSSSCADLSREELAECVVDADKARKLALKRATKAEECAAELLSTCKELLLANAELVAQIGMLKNDHELMKSSLMAQLAETRSSSRSRPWSFLARLCGGSD